MMRSALALAPAVLSVAALGAGTAMAQESPVPIVERGHSALTVSAEGKSTRSPDLAVFSAGVTTQGKTAGEALSANSQAMNRVVAALRKAGIAERDIQTSNLSINPVYSNPDNNPPIPGQPRAVLSPEERAPRIVAYQANNQVSVRQRKLADYGKVLDTLVSAGANQVSGPSFQMDNPDPAMDEARVAAIKTARQRANLYAAAAGLKVVRILSISESGGWSPRPAVAFARMEAADAVASAPVQPGELQMAAHVTVLFELAP